MRPRENHRRPKGYERGFGKRLNHMVPDKYKRVRRTIVAGVLLTIAGIMFLMFVFLESMEVNEHTEVLIKAIVRGDKKAFGQLFRMWYVRLCLYAESIVRDRDMAEDLVQNLFCMLWEKREEIDIRESMKAYLYRSVYHAALNSLKHEKVKLAFWEFIQKQGSKDENNIEYFIDKENQEIVFKEINRAIDGLPFQCRQIFLLSRFSGKKSQEIAVELGISVRTVEAQLYRAMKRLREELAHLRGSAIFWLFLLRGEKV